MRLSRSVAVRSILVGIFTATLAFTFSLASSNSTATSAAAPTSPPPGVGFNLRYANPFLLPGDDTAFPNGGDVSADPDGFDLGDVLAGSQITRQLSALGGVYPYVYTTTDATTAGLTLDLNGRVLGAPTAGTNANRFNATLLDASGLQRTGTFVLKTFTSSPFRFAIDRLPAAQVGLDFITTIETLGGDTTTTTFSVVPGSIQLNGSAITELESVGLLLFADGTLAGRPTANGTLSFTARATRNGVLALNRAGAAPDQPFTIAINVEDSIQSNMATLNATIKADFSTSTRADSLAMDFIINTDGLREQDFGNQLFTLRFAGKTFSTTLDSFGQSRRGDLRVSLLGPEGFLRVRLKNRDLGTLFTSAQLLDRSTKNTVAQITIGKDFIAAEPIRFNTRNRSGKYQLAYRLARDLPIGGLFQLTLVEGRDFFDSTSFRARFILAHVPVTPTEQFGTPQEATVNLGQNFSEPIRIFRNRGFGTGGIDFVRINPRAKVGDITTFALTEQESGIKPVRDNPNNDPQTFILGLRVLTSSLDFLGEASRRIFPF